MIPKVTHGKRVGGLLRYLYGPGRRDEHVDPRLVAGWDDPGELEPPVTVDGKRDFRRLTGLLEGPLAAVAEPYADPVWQCSLRTHADDPVLTDEQWAEAAAELVHQTGYAPRGDDDGCRWVAVRHGPDHVHVVVTLARQDGTKPSRANDYYRAQDAARSMERRFGLRVVGASDHTAASRPSRGEHEKARAQRRPEAPRETLRREVRHAAAAAGSETEFFDQLAAAGLHVKHRYGTHHPGQVTGYAVALDDDRYPDGTPVFRSGSKLAADLSLPRLRQRWLEDDHTRDTAQDGTSPRPAAGGQRDRARGLTAEERDELWRDAMHRAGSAAERIRETAGTDPAAAADAAHGAGDVLAVTARAVEGRGGGALTDAADTFDRAARELRGHRPPRTEHGDGLRAAAQLLSLAGALGDRDTTRALAVVAQIASLADELAWLRQTQQRAAQAEAARSSIVQLREVIHQHQPDGDPAGIAATNTPRAGPSRSYPQPGFRPDPARNPDPPPRRGDVPQSWPRRRGRAP